MSLCICVGAWGACVWHMHAEDNAQGLPTSDFISLFKTGSWGHVSHVTKGAGLGQEVETCPKNKSHLATGVRVTLFLFQACMPQKSHSLVAKLQG